MCPCLENGEERAARNALEVVADLPILWNRNLKEESPASFVGKLFSSSSNKNNGIPSTMTFLDGNDGPLLQVEPQNDTTDTEDLSSPLKQSTGYIKTLSLSEIKVVEYKDTNDNTITLGTRVGGKPRKLLSFQVVQHDDTSPQEVQQALQVLIAWESNRIPEDEREVEMDMNRAQKAAHFCQRELELKRMKSERDKRKAKYMNMSRKNGGGGMKYTAIAMANRADANTIT